MYVVVAPHGHGLRGLATAVVFPRRLGKIGPKGVTFIHCRCDYGVSRQPPNGLLTGDENAILAPPWESAQLDRARRVARSTAAALTS